MMVRRVVQVGFERLRLHRIDLVVFDFNASAIACYERAGFLKEGCLREARRIGEEYWSLVQMSILETEWPARVGPGRGGGADDAGSAPSPTRGTHA
jgi:RimJ/RimL family protein N-acetyltransferase